MFQSSPTPKGGRYLNILSMVNGFMTFQSSPTPKGGRYDTCLIYIASLNRCFNPRPPRKVGATLHKMQRFETGKVSILAHPERWALPRRGIVLRTRNNSFNPRPPRKVGATTPGSSSMKGPIDVSILAHPERWALRWLMTPGAQDQLMFQSSPTPKGGRYGCRLQLAELPWRDFMFQSSPTPKGGRYFDDDFLLPHPPMFQSSPTPKGGRYNNAI